MYDNILHTNERLFLSRKGKDEHAVRKVNKIQFRKFVRKKNESDLPLPTINVSAKTIDERV
jgi:hypothetical protein